MVEYLKNLDILWLLGLALLNSFVIHLFVEDSRTQDRKDYLKAVRKGFNEHHRK